MGEKGAAGPSRRSERPAFTPKLHRLSQFILPYPVHVHTVWPLEPCVHIHYLHVTISRSSYQIRGMRRARSFAAIALLAGRGLVSCS